MIDGVIRNYLAGGFWIFAGGAIGQWFYRRRLEAGRLLHEQEGRRPTGEEADAIKVRLVADAFLGGGVWLALFVLLDWLF
jgi:hypothetical protein